jgi:hypothetical protein
MNNQTQNLDGAARAVKSDVFIVASENGSIVNPYSSNKEFAWMKVQSSVLVTEGQFLRKRKRTALVKAETEILEELAEEYGTETALPGRIYVHEFLEKQLPESYLKRFRDHKLGYDKAILDFVKVHGETKAVMLQDGQRIIRFSEWDMSGKIEDIALPIGKSLSTGPLPAPTATAASEQTPELVAEQAAVLPTGQDDGELPF